MRASSRVALAMLLALAVPSWSQEEPAAPCAPPVPLNLSGNLLSPAQEAGLGQVFHDQYQLDVRLIDDPTLLAYLTAIGRRLQAHLPGDTGEVRFALTDAPGLTGVSVPGRIYISRKLVALARSEDEIAGVMAHELGHLAARHAALGLSRSIRKYLKVTQVDPTESASDLYSRLLDAIARARVDGASNESGEGEDVQQAADRLAVDAMVRSGYQAQGFADFFDRIAETRGKAGNFLSDLVGATSADSKRLRAILRTMSAIPASCVDRFSPDPAAFDAWKAAVIAYTPAAREKVPGLVWKKDLPEPLLPGVEALAFSPDGRLVLAQDDTGITVLTTSPFRTLFRAAIQEPASMRFAPDSRTFSVLTNTLRVEIWDVESARQISAQEIYRLQPCVQLVLSSDGRFFACHDTEDRLQILEVGTGAILLNRKPFVFAGPSGDSLLGRLLRPATLAFSPDNRYFLGGSDRGDPVLFDLGTRQSVDVPKALKPVVARGFAFVGPQRLATISWQEKGKSLDVVSFPEGKPLSRAPVEAIGELAAAASGDVVMMRPAGLYPVAAFDLATGRLILANVAPAFDVFNDLMVNETGDGGLDLRRFKHGEKSARVDTATLPPTSLARATAFSITPDLKRLALSDPTRGSAWDLDAGKRLVLTRAFVAAHLEADGRSMWAAFPPFRTDPAAIAKVDLTTGKIADARVGEALEQQTPLGTIVLASLPGPRDAWPPRSGGVIARDFKSGERLWTRSFDKAAPFIVVGSGDTTLALAWPLWEAAARKEVSAIPALASKMAGLKVGATDLLFEFLDERTGAPIATVIVDGSVGQLDFSLQGDRLFLTDTLGRAHLYSVRTGQRQKTLFARRVAMSPDGARVAAFNSLGRISLHDATTLARREELVFGERVIAATFDEGGRLLVLTADQTVYLVDAKP